MATAIVECPRHPRNDTTARLAVPGTEMPEVSVARRASRWASRGLLAADERGVYWRKRRDRWTGGELVGWEGLIGRTVPGALLRGSTDRRDGIQSPPLLRPVRTGACILFVDGCRAVLPPLVRPLKELRTGDKVTAGLHRMGVRDHVLVDSVSEFIWRQFPRRRRSVGRSGCSWRDVDAARHAPLTDDHGALRITAVGHVLGVVT